MILFFSIINFLLLHYKFLSSNNILQKQYYSYKRYLLYLFEQKNYALYKLLSVVCLFLTLFSNIFAFFGLFHFVEPFKNKIIKFKFSKRIIRHFIIFELLNLSTSVFIILNKDFISLFIANLYKRMFERAKELEEELMKKSYGSSVMANSMLLQLCVKLGRNRDKGQQLAEHLQVSDERIRRMLMFLEEHLSEEITIEALAETFFISKFHMMRLFKKETGQSIVEYITEQRLSLARDFICQGIPATESCFRAGFGSYSSFTRAYRKRFGTTPTGRNGRYISMDEMY